MLRCGTKTNFNEWHNNGTTTKRINLNQAARNTCMPSLLLLFVCLPFPSFVLASCMELLSVHCALCIKCFIPTHTHTAAPNGNAHIHFNLIAAINRRGFDDGVRRHWAQPTICDNGIHTVHFLTYQILRNALWSPPNQPLAIDSIAASCVRLKSHPSYSLLLWYFIRWINSNLSHSFIPRAVYWTKQN